MGNPDSDKVWNMAVDAGKELNISTSKVLSFLVIEAAHRLTPPTIKGLEGQHISRNSAQIKKQSKVAKQPIKQTEIKRK